MRTTSNLQLVINEYNKQLKPFEDEIDLEDYEIVSNTICAKESEIAKTEKRLGCSLPKELKDYYLNCANGTGKDVDSYGSWDGSLDIFSHQRVFGIVDFSAYYWDEMCMEESPFEYDTSILAELSEKEKDNLKFYNSEFFVCAVDWKENFLETFVFDKEHNFYTFCFDQDETIAIYINYINEIRNGEENEILNEEIVKSKSLSELIESYLQEQIVEIKDEYL